MIKALCIRKFRDNKNKIIGYRLVSKGGKISDISSNDLKIAIKNNKIKVINLSLTKDNRLIHTNNSKEEKKSVSIESNDSKQNVINDKVNEILSMINSSFNNNGIITNKHVIYNKDLKSVKNGYIYLSYIPTIYKVDKHNTIAQQGQIKELLIDNNELNIIVNVDIEIATNKDNIEVIKIWIDISLLQSMKSILKLLDKPEVSITLTNEFNTDTFSKIVLYIKNIIEQTQRIYEVV